MKLDFDKAKKYNAGSLTLDSLTDEAKCETAKLITGVSSESFDAYVENLKGNGYSIVYDRMLEGQIGRAHV